MEEENFLSDWQDVVWLTVSKHERLSEAKDCLDGDKLCTL